MRFGTRSHDTIDSEKKKPKAASERDRLVALLRGLADRIEGAPAERASDGLAWTGAATAAEPLVRAVERALGRSR